MTSSILSGEDIEVFENRYRKKEGGIAYNLWSARWDAKAKLMFCVRWQENISTRRNNAQERATI
jgi:hypothetical protein